MAKFQSTNYPALTVSRKDGSPLKFSGGSIEVDGEDAERLRQVATEYPHFGITEADAESAPEPTETETPDPTNDELREELVARGLPTSGNKEDLLTRLADFESGLDDEDGDEDEDEDGGE